MTHPNLYTYLAPSKVCEGVGVFALIRIPENTTIWKVKREQIRKYKWDTIPNEVESYVESITFCDEEGFWLDCELDRLYPAYYVNHSENANVRLGKLGEYITLRQVEKDEEILFNYRPSDRDW